MKNTNPELESQAQVDTVGHFINGKILSSMEGNASWKEITGHVSIQVFTRRKLRKVGQDHQ